MTDISAINYNLNATIDDESTEYEIIGCTEMSAINYNPDATTDDGSCVYDDAGCVFKFTETGVNMTVFLTSGVVSTYNLIHLI